MKELLAIGLLLICLLLLSSCAPVPPAPAPVIIENTCITPTPCLLRPTNPQTNSELDQALEQAEQDWALCALKVEAIIACHQAAKDKRHEQTQ